jgi:arylsulfatase A-like enzyme
MTRRLHAHVGRALVAGASATVLALTGCGKSHKDAPKGGDPPAGGGATGTAPAPHPGVEPVRAASRGPEHPLYSLVDNRLSAHLVRGGGLVVAAGSAGFAKYVRFGNTLSHPKTAWTLRQQHDNVRVAHMNGKSAEIDVPLTAAQLDPALIRVRAFGPKDEAFAVRVNGHKDLTGKLGAGWTTVDLPVPAGQLQEGENELLFFARNSGLDVAWIEVGGKTALADDATTFYDKASKSLVLPEGGAMVWYAFVPDKGRLTGDLADGACAVEVHATAEDGATADGKLVGIGSAVDLTALAGKAVRLELDATGCKKALLAGAAIVVPGKAPDVHRGPPPKYVVFVIMDSLRADHIRAFDPDAKPETPEWDKLAETSALFMQHYDQGNESRVSHASIWTSLYPIKHRYVSEHDKLSDKWTTIDEVAKAAGMYVAGVSANGYIRPTRGFGRAWNQFSNHIVEATGLRAEDVFKHGVRFIKDKHEPWFLYLGFVDTHVSWRAKEPWISKLDPGYTGRFKDDFSGADAGKAAASKAKNGGLTDREVQHVRALYDSNVSYQDDVLRQLVEQLKTWGIWDQTMLIVTADHGDEQWEDGRVGHGQSVRDMLVHVPMLVHYPPLVPAGKVAEGTEAIDIVPTVADALGVPMDPEWQGQSMIPLAQGVGRGYPRMSVSSMYENAHGPRIGHWKMRLSGAGAPRLYDFSKDPDEMHDLWGQASAEIGARAVLDPVWLWRSFNLEWKKSEWGNADDVSARFASDLGE